MLTHLPNDVLTETESERNLLNRVEAVAWYHANHAGQGPLVEFIEQTTTAIFQEHHPPALQHVDIYTYLCFIAAEGESRVELLGSLREQIRNLPR